MYRQFPESEGLPQKVKKNFVTSICIICFNNVCTCKIIALLHQFMHVNTIKINDSCMSLHVIDIIICGVVNFDRFLQLNPENLQMACIEYGELLEFTKITLNFTSENL